MPLSRYPAALGTSNQDVEQTAKAICSVLAVAVLASHLASALGAIVPVVSLGATFAIIILLRHNITACSRGWLWLLAFPMLALLSTLWSSVPQVTAYYAVQLLITVLGAFAVWLASGPRTFVRQLFAASALVCCVSLAGGQTGPSVSGPVLVGITGSKNSMASAAQLALFAGFALAADRLQPPVWRAIGAVMMPAAIAIIATTHAATTILLSIIAPLLYAALIAVERSPAAIRPYLAAAVLAVTIGALPVATGIADSARDLTFSTFGKDKKLSGRTYLWDVAEQKVRERPLHGHGYKAFWMSGSVDSIGLLRSQGIRDPRTFGLHQTWLEIWLDTGLVGVVVVALAVMGGIAAAFRRVLRGEGVAARFALVMLACLAIRSFGETLISPFYAYCTTLYVLLAFAILGPARKSGQQDMPSQAARPPQFRSRRASAAR